MSSPERQFEPDEIKARENMPDAGNLHVDEMLKLLEHNPYYNDLVLLQREQLLNLNNIRATFAYRASLIDRYFELLGNTRGDTDSDELESVCVKLEDEGIVDGESDVDVEMIKIKHQAAEQIIRWVDGIFEVAGQSIKIESGSDIVIEELDALAASGNNYADEARKYILAANKEGESREQAVKRFKSYLDQRLIVAANKGDLASLRQGRDLLQILDKWFPD